MLSFVISCGRLQQLSYQLAIPLALKLCCFERMSKTAYPRNSQMLHESWSPGHVIKQAACACLQPKEQATTLMFAQWLVLQRMYKASSAYFDYVSFSDLPFSDLMIILVWIFLCHILPSHGCCWYHHFISHLYLNWIVWGHATTMLLKENTKWLQAGDVVLWLKSLLICACISLLGQDCLVRSSLRQTKHNLQNLCNHGMFII